MTICAPIGVGTSAVAGELAQHGYCVHTVAASTLDADQLHERDLIDGRTSSPSPAMEVLLLLADDVPVADARTLAGDLRARWSGPLVVIATAPTGLPEEQVVRQDPLPLDEAVSTLHDLVEAGRGRAPDQSEHALLERIAEATDGLDVALEVAGNRLGRRRADRVLVEMTGAADYLARPVANAVAELSPLGLRLLTTLAPLEDWFDTVDGHRVLKRPRPPMAAVEAAIDHLVDAGLVHFDPARPEPYRIPRPIAIAVRARVQQEGTSAIPELARMLAARAVLTAGLIATTREAEAAAWFERRHVALERLAAHPEAALTHRRAIMRSLIHTTLAIGRTDVAHALLGSTRVGTELGRRDLLAIATVAYVSDDYRIVDECVKLAGPLSASDPVGMELVFRQVRAMRHRCEFGQAHRRLDDLAELATAGTATMATCDMERGMALTMEARTGEARASLALAREAFGRLGVERAVGGCWVYEAWCDLADGRTSRAAPALERTRAIATALGHRADVAFTELLLARLRLIDADTEGAITLATSSLDHFRTANDRLGAARALEILADASAARVVDICAQLS